MVSSRPSRRFAGASAFFVDVLIRRGVGTSSFLPNSTTLPVASRVRAGCPALEVLPSIDALMWPPMPFATCISFNHTIYRDPGFHADGFESTHEALEQRTRNPELARIDPLRCAYWNCTRLLTRKTTSPTDFCGIVVE